jgi:hypothetical protein
VAATAGKAGGVRALSNVCPLCSNTNRSKLRAKSAALTISAPRDTARGATGAWEGVAAGDTAGGVETTGAV